MAIDPSISLAVRPPVIPPLQIQTPLEKFAKIQTLRSLMNQGQLGQMNIEQTRLENEALQRNAQEAQTLGSWMQQNQQRSQDITPQEIVAAHPNPTGIKFATAWSAQQTAALTQRKAVLEAAHEEAKTDDRIYNSVVDDTSKMAALAELVRLKRIDSTMASHLTAIPFDSPEFKGIQQRAAAQSLDRLQRIEAAKKEIDLRIAQTTEPSVTQKVIDEATKAKQEVEGTQPITLYQQAQLNLDKVGKTEPYPQPVQTQKVEQQAALGSAAEMAKLAIQRGDNAALVKTVIADSTGTIYAGLPPEIQRQIAPELGRQGFTKFEAKPTAAQDTAAAYAARVKQANPVLEQVVQSLGERAWNSLAPAEFLKTEQGQVFQQAERNFINAVLRRESGAVISPSEFAEARRQYIPQANESQAVLNQKRDNRLIAQQALIHAAGTAYRDPEQLLKEAGAPAAPAAVSSGTGEAPAGSTPGLEVSKPGAEPKMVWIGPDGKKYYKPPPVQQITVTDPRGVVHTFKTAKQAEDFKKAAGIQ